MAGLAIWGKSKLGVLIYLASIGFGFGVDFGLVRVWKILSPNHLIMHILGVVVLFILLREWGKGHYFTRY